MYRMAFNYTNGKTCNLIKEIDTECIIMRYKEKLKLSMVIAFGTIAFWSGTLNKSAIIDFET